MNFLAKYKKYCEKVTAGDCILGLQYSRMYFIVIILVITGAESAGTEASWLLRWNREGVQAMKTAFISGASHGIGKAIAYKLASQGCSLALNCKNSKETLEKLCQELAERYGVMTLPLVGDIADYTAVCQMFAKTEERLGMVDFLINNAGISQIGLLSELSVQDWHTMIDTNLSAVFYCCKLAIPGMVRKKSGKILNISSVWGETGASCEAAYSAAKGGVNALTKALAKELAPSGIQVNAIACGCIDTRMNACFRAEERAELEQEIPSGRYGTPQEVAAFAWQLLSGNDYLTGQVIRFDGGWL